MERPLRLLMVGDVVGPVGCAAATALLPALRRELALDGVIINGENSAPNGFGITEQTAAALLAVADFVTLGDHAFDQPGIAALLDREPRIIRPANFKTSPGGRGWGMFTVAGARVGVGNLLGHIFMRPEVRPTRATADEMIAALTEAGADCIVIDMQAEATSEKQGLGRHLAGRVAAVLGTHTHVPTADLRILPGGTAYVSDVGMTGARDGIIGFNRAEPPTGPDGGPRQPPLPADGVARLDAVLIAVSTANGRAVACERVYREWDGV